MASVSWTATTNGTWSNGANWSVPGGPLAGDDVSITGSAGLLGVTYNTASLSIDSLTTSNTSFDVTAGTLHVTGGYTLGGTLVQGAGLLQLDAGNLGDTITGSVALSGGMLALEGGATLQGGTLTQTGGTLSILRGVLTDNDASTTLTGLVSGGGQLLLEGASTILAQGLVLSTGSVNVQNGNVYLYENLTYAHTFTLQQAGTLNLGTSKLSLTGLADLEGTVANSTLALAGTGHLNQLTLENGATAALSGTYSQTGAVNLGQLGTGIVSIAAGGVLRETANTTITNTDSGGTLVNAGLLIKTGGNGVIGSTQIMASLINTGTIASSIGTIAFSAPSNGATSTLGGTITGAGTVALEAGNFALASSSANLTVAHLLLAGSASATLTSNSLTYGGDYAQTGGTLIVGVPGQGGGSLTLLGPDALDSGLLKGTGTVMFDGAVHLGGGMALDGNLTFDFGASTAATVSQTGTIQLGAELDAITNATLSATESWLLEGNAAILGTNGTITNRGLFEKASGGGTSTVQNNFNNIGSLVVASGVLNLSGGGVLGGTVGGAAALDISGDLAFGGTLSNGGAAVPALTLTVGELLLDGGQIQLNQNLSYGGGWSQESGTLALGNQDTLTLTGITSLASGAIEGPGAIVIDGAATLNQGPYPLQQLGLLQGAQLTLAGATEQGGTLALTGGSGAPTLTIGTTSTYTLDQGASIGTPGSSVVGTLNVAGTLAASADGTSSVVAFVNDTGTIKVANGDLTFMGTLTGAGSLTISSGGTLELDTSNTITSAINFGTGSGVLSLDNPNDFHSTIGGFASGDVIELQGFAFANLTPVVSGDTVSLTETNGQSITLTFSTTQTASSLAIYEGPHGGIALVHT